MCLYSQNIRPLVADRDIKVLKLVRYDSDNNRFSAPHQGTTITLNQTLVAEGNATILPTDYSDNELGIGFIHAFISENSDICYEFAGQSLFCVEAIIKAGTPFHVQFDFKEVAATEMYISDRKILPSDMEQARKDLKETRDYILSLVEKQMEKGINDVAVGDLMLSDHTFVKRDALTASMNVIGVVSFIRENGQPNIIALQESCEQWLSNRGDNRVVNPIENRKEAHADYDGINNTRRLKELFQGNFDDAPALKYCLEYKTDGTEAGDWFFMSTGEILQTVRNAYVVNQSIERLNELHKGEEGYVKAKPITLDAWYWASGEGSSTSAWTCSSNYAYVYSNYTKWTAGYVRPSLAF